MRDHAAVEAAYEWLSARHPTAPLATIGPDGLFVAPPEGVDPGRHVALKGRSALDFVQPADRVAVVHAWERARAERASRVHVRLITGEAAYLHFFDLRHREGCYMAIFAPADDAPTGVDVLAGHADRSKIPPRVCRMRRNEVAEVVELDRATTALLGWEPAELLARRSIELVHPDDVERAIANWMEMLATPDEPHRWRGRYACADGSWLWLDITNTNRLDDGEHGDVLTEMVDVSDEMAMHEALREREQLLRRLTEALPSAVVQFDAERRVLHANEQVADLVGDGTLDAVIDAVVDEDRATLQQALDDVLGAGIDTDLELRLTGDRVCRVALRALTGDAGTVSGGLACIDDVTESARLRRQLEVRATFDALTACFSRSAILTALDTAAGSSEGTGVIFVDLDGFKAINDDLGHAAGDELLAAVGERLRAAVRDVDLVGRLGGDEFLVVCPGVAGEAALAAIAGRITDLVHSSLVVGDHVVSPRASIGTAWAPPGCDASALVAEADAAMYAAKRRVAP